MNKGLMMAQVKIHTEKMVHLKDGRSISFKPDAIVDGELASIALKEKIGSKVVTVKSLNKTNTKKGD